MGPSAFSVPSVSAPSATEDVACTSFRSTKGESSRKGRFPLELLLGFS